MKKLALFLIFVSAFFVFPNVVFAHPGRTAADGCHYCRTNCEKWGEVYGARHCHGGGSSTTTTTTTNTYIAPAPSPSPKVYSPIPSPVPTPKPSPTPSLSPSPSPSPSPTPEPSPDVAGVSDEVDNQDSKAADEDTFGETMGGLIFLGGAGYGGYRWVRGKVKH